MQTLKNLISTLGSRYSLQQINFKHGASGQKITRKGYSIWYSNPDTGNKIEVFTFEPCDYTNGDKWMVYGEMWRKYNGLLCYFKNIQSAVKEINKTCFHNS